MRIGVICNDRWHPAEVVQQGMEPLADDATILEFLQDTDGWTPERMRQYDVLVLSKGNGRAEGEAQDWMTNAVQQSFAEFVTEGGGMLVCHSGTVGLQDAPLLRGLVGGVFVRHPHHCPVTLTYLSDFGVADGDPKTIEIHDEHYFVETADDIDVFMTSVSENGTQPAGWTRREGKGRVCVLTPGHFSEVWRHPVYQHTLRNTLNWCGSREQAV